jgi:hypothetical protein
MGLVARVLVQVPCRAGAGVLCAMWRDESVYEPEKLGRRISVAEG